MVSVEVMRLRDAPQDFAEAEGDGGYDGRREGHIRFFERNGGFDPDMKLVCERFRLVEDLAEGAPCSPAS